MAFTNRRCRVSGPMQFIDLDQESWPQMLIVYLVERVHSAAEYSEE
jgi:hypothetical protein